MADSVAYFACCPDEEAMGELVAPTGATPVSERHGPMLRAATPPQRCSGMGYHEAGHAICALALGGTALSATIDMQPHAMTGGPMPLEARIGVYVAGDVAQRWRDRRIFRPLDADLMPILRRVDDCKGGSCDFCAALRLCTLLAPNGDLDGALAVYRQIEERTIDLMTRREIAAAVAALAARLMAVGTVHEAEIMTIAERHFAPGAYSLNPTEKE